MRSQNIIKRNAYIQNTILNGYWNKFCKYSIHQSQHYSHNPLNKSSLIDDIKHNSNHSSKSSNQTMIIKSDIQQLKHQQQLKKQLQINKELRQKFSPLLSQMCYSLTLQRFFFIQWIFSFGKILKSINFHFNSLFEQIIFRSCRNWRESAIETLQMRCKVSNFV